MFLERVTEPIPAPERVVQALGIVAVAPPMAVKQFRVIQECPAAARPEQFMAPYKLPPIRAAAAEPVQEILAPQAAA